MGNATGLGCNEVDSAGTGAKTDGAGISTRISTGTMNDNEAGGGGRRGRHCSTIDTNKQMLKVRFTMQTRTKPQQCQTRPTKHLY